MAHVRCPVGCGPALQPQLGELGVQIQDREQSSRRLLLRASCSLL